MAIGGGALVGMAIGGAGMLVYKVFQDKKIYRAVVYSRNYAVDGVHDVGDKVRSAPILT